MTFEKNKQLYKGFFLLFCKYIYKYNKIVTKTVFEIKLKVISINVRAILNFLKIEKF